MVRLTSTVALSVLALVAGSCGDSAEETAQPSAPPPPLGPSTQPRAGTQPNIQPGQPAAEPQGRLSDEEYRSIVREYRMLNPLSSAVDVQAAIARARVACVWEPRTNLMNYVRDDCEQALAFYNSLDELQQVQSRCPGSGDDYQRECISNTYLKFAIMTGNSITKALKINEELERRKIGGVCALSVGIRPEQIEFMSNLSKAARGVATNLNAGLGEEAIRSQDELDRVLNDGDHAPDPLTGILRNCKHGTPQRTAPKPKPKPQPKPKSPSRPLPSEPDGDGINA